MKKNKYMNVDSNGWIGQGFLRGDHNNENRMPTSSQNFTRLIVRIYMG